MGMSSIEFPPTKLVTYIKFTAMSNKFLCWPQRDAQPYAILTIPGTERVSCIKSEFSSKPIH